MDMYYILEKPIFRNCLTFGPRVDYNILQFRRATHIETELRDILLSKPARSCLRRIPKESGEFWGILFAVRILYEAVKKDFTVKDLFQNCSELIPSLGKLVQIENEVQNFQKELVRKV